MSKKDDKLERKRKIQDKKEELQKQISENLDTIQGEKKKTFLSKYSLEQKRKFINIVTIVGLAISILLVIFLWKDGYITDKEKLSKAIKSLGLLAPIAFFFIQILQVVIPIIPGGVTSIAGVMIFGPFWGFILNHFSMLIGSCINFWLARIYGTAFIKIFLSDENYKKYERWLEGDKKFPFFFGLAMFLPGMPDDIICLVAGVTNMTFKQFFVIYNLTKPFGLLGYSMFFAYFDKILQYFENLFS